ncbi:MAG: carboxylesterase family protein [Bacteroidales bacterium]|nr:carboxylesterase family protein [Bacteroidales bacterium]
MVVPTKGLVKGIEEEGSLAFKGNPYATVERFMPPKPVAPWDTVMVCDHFGPQVMQGKRRLEIDLYFRVKRGTRSSGTSST